MAKSSGGARSAERAPSLETRVNNMFGGSPADDPLKTYTASVLDQIAALRAGGSDYQMQSARTIEQRLERQLNGEESWPAFLFQAPKRATTRRAAAPRRGRGDASKVDPGMAREALRRAKGDKRAAYSQVVIMTSLRPGFDNVDLQAFYRDAGL